MRVAYNFYVYMMTNRWKNVLYTGVTNDLMRRVWQYRNGVKEGFTKKYNCDRLVYFEWYQDIRQAIERETEIKKWSRAKKDALILTMNSEWKDLAEEWGIPDERRLPKGSKMSGRQLSFRTGEARRGIPSGNTMIAPHARHSSPSSAGAPAVRNDSCARAQSTRSLRRVESCHSEPAKHGEESPDHLPRF